MFHVSKKVIFFVLVFLYGLFAPQLFAADESQTASGIVLKASDIKYHQAPGFPKGAEIVLIQGDLSKKVPYTIRFKFADGFVVPSHWHSTDEQVTVLSGILNVGTGDKVEKSQSTALPAGGFQLVPANVRHYIWMTGETVIQLDGMGPRTTFFVNPAEWNAMIQKSNK